jgi:DNA-binding SARP family transcriptional activator/Tfp pilus assembly protein PilF
VPAAMEFGLLGPVQVRVDGQTVPVPRGSQRDVLAALLLAAGQVVSLDQLAEVLWGEQPPPSAQMTVRNYVRRLRQALGDAGRERISTQPHGYLITVAAGELDVSRFESLLQAAQAAARAGRWQACADQAGQALALWRGEPLADVDSEVLVLREAPRLAELRLQAAEAWAGAALHLGRHDEAAGELQRLAAAHPLREHLHALLMLARYRAGRPGEALAVYQQARRALADELGVEPGAELRDLQQRILARDPALAGPGPAPGGEPAQAAGPRLAVPRELPGAVRNFVGRADELTALSGLLEHAGELAPGTLVISAIGGTAGVGKTALALQWAHRVAEQFPDGQLYLNLRGYDPREPMPTAEALAALLRSLGVSGHDIPAEAEERAVRYRSLLAGRRMLIVLDNAREAPQVRPLLPGTPGCVTLVTSRDSLAGLVARDGARRLDLDLLPDAEAVALLRALIGDRAVADPATTRALARACSHLPLALRVAAELAAARPGVPLADLAAELAGVRGLDLLDDTEDHQASVRAVFSWSCRHLEAPVARAFRLAGLHPGHDFDRYAVAALTGTPPEQAGRALAVLARAHLIQPIGADRYSLHDLLRGYARELADGETEQDQRTALTRLLDYYLGGAAAAMDATFPGERHRRPAIPPSGAALPRLDDDAAARAWLDTERASLITMAVYAADNGWPGHATRLSAILFRYLDTGGHYAEARTIHRSAADAADRAGDRPAQASALIGLGLAYGQQDGRQEAEASYEQALAVASQAGDQDGQARALNYLGIGAFRMGRYEEATSELERSLTLFRATGEPTGAAYVLGNLAEISARLGRYEGAVRYLEQALAAFRQLGDRHGEASIQHRMGVARLRQGQDGRAAESFAASLVLYRDFGDPMGEASALTDLGRVALRQGRGEQATSQLRQALALYRDLGDQAGEGRALNGLGEALLAAGRAAEARACHADALELCTRASDRSEQANSLDGLGHCAAALGDAGQARRQWEQALALYTELGMPDAERLRARLSQLD